ncbi:MAG TPA: hypothetical protein VI485_12315 [Vicinamibacterales bacterium]|nr:hypothetical protein [Vicinamibacterales bacterium]
MQEPGHGHADAVHFESPALVPHRFEVEAGHYQGQIDLEIALTSSSHESASLDHTTSQFLVARTIQRFVAGPQGHTRRLTGLPGS